MQTVDVPGHEMNSKHSAWSSWAIRLAALIIVVVALTLIGAYQTLFLKEPSPISTSLWFPLAIILKRVTGSEIAMSAATFVQFPMFAAVLEGLLRRYGWRISLGITFCCYVLIVLIAFSIVRGN